jgi:hypothetical protein
MQQASGSANSMLPATMPAGVQFMDPRMAPAIRAAAPAAFDGDSRGDSDGGSRSGGEADQNTRDAAGTGTPERGENAVAEAPLRRARVSVRARSEAPMVCQSKSPESIAMGTFFSMFGGCMFYAFTLVLFVVEFFLHCWDFLFLNLWPLGAPCI